MLSMTDLRRRLGIEHAIVQAPLGGGPTTPEMVVAVVEAGALGSLAGGYLSGAAITAAVGTVRARTDRPFAINLLVPPSSAPPSTAGVADMLAWLAPYYQELGLPPPSIPERFAEPFAEQVQAVLAARPAVFSFTFGIPSADVLAACRAASIVTMGTATTVAEGRLLEQARVDAVVAQGSEAGGHRGTFAGPFQAGMIGTMALVPQMVDALSVPVVAAGGIMDGRGIVAARALGAAGVQLGTAFLACAESGIPAVYKNAIRAARDDATTVTRAFSGRPLRVVRNRFVDEMDERPTPEYPVQNTLTRPLRAAAAARGDASLMGLLAGQGAHLARETSCAQLVHQLVEEFEAVVARLAGLAPPSGEPVVAAARQGSGRREPRGGSA